MCHIIARRVFLRLLPTAVPAPPLAPSVHEIWAGVFAVSMVRFLPTAHENKCVQPFIMKNTTWNGKKRLVRPHKGTDAFHSPLCQNSKNNRAGGEERFDGKKG